MSKNKINISVREIIEYVLRTGDIDTSFLGASPLVDGIKAHQEFQNNAGDDYEKEVSISLELNFDSISININGRIDGIIKNHDIITIDEIKTTGKDLDKISGDNELHWAQVKIYSYMYMYNNNISKINSRITYIELETKKVKQYEQVYEYSELEKYSIEIIQKYINWAKKLDSWKCISTESINKTDFPFSGYREGQRQLMNAVYKTIIENNILFSRAPTGIGKTIATLFPSIKVLGQGKCDKIFYLTAKTVGKEVAANTLNILGGKGLEIKRTVITAKEKICINDNSNCNPVDCIYAKGHYDRVNKVVEEMYDKHDYYNRDLVEEYSRRYQLCPYELSLDLALYSDIIICDYNYVFDPSAVLRRFFVESVGRYVILIDEAHNLVDRARNMYSATIEKNRVLDLYKKVKAIDSTLYRYLKELNKLLIETRRKCEQHTDNRCENVDKPLELEKILRGIVHRIEKIFVINKNWEYVDELLDFYFEAYDFLKKAELYNEKYITYYEKQRQNILVKLFCIDPSTNIKEAIKNMQGVVFFSATLLPMEYYIKLLGGNEKSYGLILPSPFDPKNLKLLIEKNISTKYNNRLMSIKPIVKTIKDVVNCKRGNYIVFFPSYKYMEDVYEEYLYEADNIEEDIIIQNKGLSEIEKESFINEFYKDRKKSLLAFAVLGGMFSEGIDLSGDKLSGAIIVGVGLPQICYERDIIKKYFDVNLRRGFEFSYVYPGMNKVMQAAGRVIRTVTDKGIVVLIDERFNQKYYNRLFPIEWSHAYVIKLSDNINNLLEEFWSE